MGAGFNIEKITVKGFDYCLTIKSSDDTIKMEVPIIKEAFFALLCVAEKHERIENTPDAG